MEGIETDAATLLGMLVLKVLGVDIKNEEECESLRNGLKMLHSDQMQEHCRKAAVKHKGKHPRMNSEEARRIIMMLQFEAVYTRSAGIRKRKKTWFNFGGSVTVASRSAKRTNMDEGDKGDKGDEEAYYDIICYVSTMMEVAKRSGDKIKIKGQVEKMSAPSN
jgi:hypothetical protein